MQEENITNPEESQGLNENLPPVEKSSGQEPEIEKPGQRKTLLTMQNVLLFILLAGMIVLYVLHFTAPAAEEPRANVALQKSGEKGISVVFVNIDTLNERYAFIKKLKTDLEGTGKRMQTEVLSEQASFEREAAEFQKQVAANAITEEKAKAVYEELMQKQQALLDKKERYTQQVAEMEMNMNLRLLDTVTNFLKRYNKIYKFDYILTYKTAGDILVANDTLDITNDVVRALNKEYGEREK